ncbi:major facilitator superfamily domain-containing protein 6-like [Oculina patagonica]
MPDTPLQEPTEKSNNVFKFCSQYKTRIALGLFYFFFETSFSFKMFFLPVYWQQLGLSPTQIGILRAVWGVAYSVGAVIFGQMASKWKIRRALLLMSILSTAITPLVSLLPRRTHDKCTVQFEKALPQSTRERRAAVVHEGQNSFHFDHQWINSLVAGRMNSKDHNNHLNRTFSLQSHLKQVEGKRVLEKNAIDLKHMKKGFGKLHSLQQPRSLMPRGVPRQLSVNHAKVFTLEKNPEDIKFIFIMFVFIVFVGELLSSPAFNLANSEIVEYLGENSREFGRIRLWGPIGHMIAAPTTALLVTHYHYELCGEYQDNFAIVFGVISLMASCAFVSVTQFENEKTEHSDTMTQDGDSGTPVTLIKFFSQYQNFVFILMTFLVGCFDGVVLTFGFWYTKTLDVSIATLVFGFSRMTCSAVSVVFLGFIGMCVKKTGYTGVTVFSMLLFVCWFIGMSFMKNPWFMLIFETIGYIAYVVGFTGLISYFGEVTPRHLMDTVQGGVNSLFLGVGCGIGTALCGFFIDAIGAVNAFRLFAAGTLVLLVLFVASQAAYFCLGSNKDGEKRKCLE